MVSSDNETLSNSISMKPLKEWKCSLFQVITTSEQGINKHLQGKKHKAKEAKVVLREIQSHNRGPHLSFSLCIVYILVYGWIMVNDHFLIFTTVVHKFLSLNIKNSSLIHRFLYFLM